PARAAVPAARDGQAAERRAGKRVGSAPADGREVDISRGQPGPHHRSAEERQAADVFSLRERSGQAAGSAAEEAGTVGDRDRAEARQGYLVLVTYIGFPK